MSSPNSVVVTINAGGTRFQTWRETLIRGSPYFQALFTGGFAESLDCDDDGEEKAKEAKKDKEIFLDMNPKLFAICLDRMRYPEYPVPKDKPGLDMALAFLGIVVPLPPPLPKPSIVDESLPVDYDPMSMELEKKIQVGDQVRIWSIPDQKWFSGRVLRGPPNFCFDLAKARLDDALPGIRGHLRSFSDEETQKILAREARLN